MFELTSPLRYRGGACLGVLPCDSTHLEVMSSPVPDHLICCHYLERWFLFSLSCTAELTIAAEAGALACCFVMLSLCKSLTLLSFSADCLEIRELRLLFGVRGTVELPVCLEPRLHWLTPFPFYPWCFQ